MYRILLLALLAAPLVVLPADVQAQTARQARGEVEASMLVTGHVDIDREGRVTAHTLDRQDDLPDYVVDLVGSTIAGLAFEPVVDQGQPALARAKMSLRLVAAQADDGKMTVRVRSAHFGEEYSEDDATSVRYANMRPPRYPDDVLRMGGKGTVYLLLKVGRDGGVEDVLAEQVNLTALGNARQMETVRTRLADAAVKGARNWTFTPPTEGEAAGKEHWVIRVPVEYTLGGDRETAYGQWAAYHPGTRHSPDWARPTPAGFSPDALMAGGVTPETSRFKLLTPLGG